MFSWTFCFFLTFEGHKVLISSVKQSGFEVSPLYVIFFFFFSNADLFDYVLKITIKTVLGGKKNVLKGTFCQQNEESASLTSCSEHLLIVFMQYQ